MMMVSMRRSVSFVLQFNIFAGQKDATKKHRCSMNENLSNDDGKYVQVRIICITI